MIIIFFHESRFKNMIDYFAMFSSPPLTLFPPPPALLSRLTPEKIKPYWQMG